MKASDIAISAGNTYQKLKKKNYLLHPLLFALFPLLFFYNFNLSEVSPRDLIKPFLGVLCFALLFFWIFSLILKKKHKTAVFSSVFFILIFSSGHVNNFLTGFFAPWYQQTVKPDYFLTGWMFLIILTAFLIIRSGKNFIRTSKAFNMISFALTVFIFGNIIYFEAGRSIFSKETINNTGKDFNNTSQVNSDSLPDIYYIIAERYASNRTLKEYFRYDNKDFSFFLKEQGFYIAENSRSNYITTTPSLASSLNMTYLDETAKKMGSANKDRGPLFNMIYQHSVSKYLKARGYKYIHVGSYWGHTVYNRSADVNYSYHTRLPLSEFSWRFLETSIFWPVISKFTSGDFEERNLHYNLSLDQIEKIVEYSKEKGPKYVFAHLYITHQPYLFDKNGQMLSKEEEEKNDYKENYINTLTYANSRFEYMIRGILKNSRNKPIIIFQGDEGPYPDGFWQDMYYYNWKKATGDELRQKARIMNAYYLPGKDNTGLYSSITPVNTFRLIFNLYFGENLPFLTDITYAHESYQTPYKFFNVSSIIQ